MRLAYNQKIVFILIIASAIFLDRLDLTIVNIALPTLANIFKISVTQLDWISNSFLIALACFIPVSGWVGERYGLKETFIVSTLIFALGTLLCALSFNLLSIIIFRFIQGIGGGMLVPIGMALVYKSFDHKDYASVTSYIFIPSLLAPAIAPFLGAVIMAYLSWRWIFLAAIPACVLIIISAYFFIKNNRDEIVVKTPCDQIGIMLTCGFLVTLQLFLSEIGRSGLTINSFVILTICFFIFYAWYRRESNFPYPLINLTYFKNKTFIAANLIQLAFQSCHFGSFFLIGLYLQIGLGFSAIATGIIIGMQAIGAILTSRFSVYLYKRYDAYIPISIGFIGIALFSYAILFLIRTNTEAMLYTGMVILFFRGIFSGLCGTPIQTLSVVSFQKTEMADINAIFNTCRQVAISLGIALSSLLIGYGAKIEKSSLTNFHQSYIIVQGTFQYAFLLIPILCFFGFLVNLAMLLTIRKAGAIASISNK